MYRISSELLTFLVVTIIVLFIVAVVAIKSRSNIKNELYQKNKAFSELEIKRADDIKEITDQIKNLHAEYQDKLKEVQRQKEENIKALNATFRKLLDEVNDQRDKHLKNNKNQSGTMIDSLKFDIENLHNEYQDQLKVVQMQNNEYQNKLKVVQAQKEENIKSLNATFQRLLDDVKDQKEKLHFKVIKLEEEKKILEAKIKDLKKNFKYFDEAISFNYYENYVRQYLNVLQQFDDFAKEELSSNKTAIPYLAGFIADLKTIDFDRLALSLSWGDNKERKKKVDSLNSLKKESKERIEELKWAEYQLDYLLELYPALSDVIDAEFSELNLSYDDITDYDPVIKWISKEEWNALSESERNQLALDRYIESRKKSKWQIGRDYELYCGYNYEKEGYKVDYYGNYKGLEDLGRDLIVSCFDKTTIVQCKYWSQSKKIHEKHIMQLYGTVVEYNIEHGAKATGLLITNISLSEKAKQFASILGVEYIENHEIKEFPRIKCNIAKDDNGIITHIYHLPMDLNYDRTKINNKGEFMALTVAEAEAAGFRRAYKWHGN